MAKKDNVRNDDDKKEESKQKGQMTVAKVGRKCGEAVSEKYG